MPDPTLDLNSYLANQAPPAAGSSSLTLDGYLQGDNGATTQPDALERALNYHTGSDWLDIPLGLVQGAGKGALTSVLGGMDIVRKLQGQPEVVTPEDKTLLTTPNGPGQGTGKFLEQAAEFAIPDAAMGEATKGADLISRLLAKSMTSGGVAAVQSGGDPLATAVGAGLGAAGEVVSGVKELASAPKAPTLENYSNSFGATPIQRPVIGKYLALMQQDGIAPTGSVTDTQTAIKNRLAQLGQQYNALDPNIGTRQADPYAVLKDLDAEMAKYRRGDVTSEANKANVAQIQKEKDAVEMLAVQNPSGQLSFDDLRYLRDGMNGRTNFNTTDAEDELYRSLGDVYRSAMDRVAPETTQLNQNYAAYKNLESVIDKNVNMGRGIVRSGFDKGMEAGSDRNIGAAMGGFMGHMTGIPGGEFLGAMGGSVLYPKLSAPVFAALKNASENGTLDRLSAPTKAALKAALQTGDSGRILSLLGTGSTRKMLTSAAAQ